MDIIILTCISIMFVYTEHDHMIFSASLHFIVFNLEVYPRLQTHLPLAVCPQCRPSEQQRHMACEVMSEWNALEFLS